tara:strand:- start:20 stop:1276 length:1257 start_codon:yes stop_codon:yes gene_type:complete
MAQWRKVIVSGSNAELNQVTASSGIDIQSTTISGSSTSTGSFGFLNIHGDGVFGGNLTFGDAATDSVTFGADIDSNLIPNADDTYDLGSATQAWQDLFLEGDITFTDAGKIVTSAGDLTIEAEANDSAVVIKGDHESGTSIHLDGNANANSVVDIDAGILDVDTAGAANIDAAGAVSLQGGGASDFTTSAGSITIDSTAAGLVLDGHTGVDIDASNSGKVAIDGAGGIDIGVAADVAIDIDSSTLDIDASSNVTIDASGGSISVGTNSNGRAITIGHTTSEVTIGDNLTVNGNATITGDLDINGTLTTIDTTNLRVADKFIIMASGSTSGDSGLVASTAANGSGSAFFFDDSATRWGLTGADETGDSQISATPRQYLTSVSQSGVDPSGNPSDFGTDAATRRGMIHVNSSTGDIFIFS